jgi:monothiol glutaredoxin
MMNVLRINVPSLVSNAFKTHVRLLSAATKQEEIGQLVKNNKVVVFMKGVPTEPKCGFSNAVVQILRMHGVKYDAHDVLKDEELREGIKEFSKWPTIPQIFISGEFVGGCDIMLQLHQSGDLIEELEKAGIKSALVDSGDKKEEK